MTHYRTPCALRVARFTAANAIALLPLGVDRERDLVPHLGLTCDVADDARYGLTDEGRLINAA